MSGWEVNERSASVQGRGKCIELEIDGEDLEVRVDQGHGWATESTVALIPLSVLRKLLATVDSVSGDPAPAAGPPVDCKHDRKSGVTDTPNEWRCIDCGETGARPSEARPQCRKKFNPIDAPRRQCERVDGHLGDCGMRFMNEPVPTEPCPNEATPDPIASAFTSLPINDDRSPERKARWEAAIEEIRAGQYERPVPEINLFDALKEIKTLLENDQACSALAVLSRVGRLGMYAPQRTNDATPAADLGRYRSWEDPVTGEILYAPHEHGCFTSLNPPGGCTCVPRDREPRTGQAAPVDRETFEQACLDLSRAVNERDALRDEVARLKACSDYPRIEATEKGTDDCTTCGGQGFYSLSDDPDTEIPCETCQPPKSRTDGARFKGVDLGRCAFLAAQEVATTASAPVWEDLRNKERRAWVAAACAVANLVAPRSGPRAETARATELQAVRDQAIRDCMAAIDGGGVDEDGLLLTPRERVQELLKPHAWAMLKESDGRDG